MSNILKPARAANTSLHIVLVAQISPDRSLQLGRAIAKRVGQVIQVVASGDTKATHKVLGRRLEVAVILLGLVVGTAEVGIG